MFLFFRNSPFLLNNILVCAIQFDIWRFGSDISFSDTVSSTVGIFPIEIYSTFFVCQPMQITKLYSMLINRNNILVGDFFNLKMEIMMF